ncbi:AMP-binding protein [Roseimaritima ulvae]|nr:AMP-binding protein [Roseimaritima ulvae]
MLIGSLLRHATERPRDPALWVEHRWWCWQELLQAVLANADRLTGYPSGARFVTTFANDARAVVGALSLMVDGHVEVPLGDQHSAEHVQSVRSRSNAAAQLSCQDVGLAVAGDPNVGIKRLQRSLQDRRPDDDALILWTSGTTARPRGVVLSCGALFANASGKLDAVPQTPRQRRLTVLPLWHSFARTCDLGTWLISGGALAVTLGWKGMLASAPAVQPQLVSVVPSLVKRMLAAGGAELDAQMRQWGLGQLQILACGGAALAAEDYRRLTALGLCVIHGYGLTEAGPTICSASPDTVRPGYVGRPIRDTQIRIDANGELWARGPGLMTRYLDDPAATAAVLQNGWLRTGDLALQDADGMVRILGRRDETIVCSNGLKLQPLEVEQMLQRSEAVQHAVLWQDDADQLVAIIEPAQYAKPAVDVVQELESLAAQLVSWKRPRRWAILSQPLAPEERTAKGTPKRRIVGPRYAPTATTFATGKASPG